MLSQSAAAFPPPPPPPLPLPGLERPGRATVPPREAERGTPVQYEKSGQKKKDQWKGPDKGKSRYEKQRRQEEKLRKKRKKESQKRQAEKERERKKRLERKKRQKEKTARKNERQRREQRERYERHPSTFSEFIRPAIPYGTIRPRIPVNHSVIYVQGVLFYFYEGTFYQRHQSNYITVQAPVGATVVMLPGNDYITTNVGGQTYFIYNGSYYIQVDSGYMVVPAPSHYEEVKPVLPEPACSGWIVVTSRLLNVRSCPGKRHPIIGKLYQREVLEIHGYAKRWYYVQLPDGRFGWIHSRFTAPAEF